MGSMQDRLAILRAIFLEIFPEFRGYHFPVRARVVRVHEDAGRIGDHGRRYSVDVQPLRPDGSEDDQAPVIPDVELPVIWAGPGRGIYALPEVGSIVRIGFYYNDPSAPFVDAVLGYGFDCPAHPAGSLIIQQADGTSIEIDPEHNVHLRTPETLIGDIGKSWKIKTESAEIQCSKTALVTAGETAHVDAPQVNLAGGGQAIVLESIAQWLNSHKHSNGNGGYPTGPPVSPVSNYKSAKTFSG